jgi:hypothetical protein
MERKGGTSDGEEERPLVAADNEPDAQWCFDENAVPISGMQEYSKAGPRDELGSGDLANRGHQRADVFASMLPIVKGFFAVPPAMRTGYPHHWRQIGGSR